MKNPERRTSVDLVFDHLYDEIASMRLLPGAKISEAEIASQFDVSRQPVRDAFSRLENLDLLLIRPQRATEVKRFSSIAITKARFVRAAIEAEVIRIAARKCTAADKELLQACLIEQDTAVKQGQFDQFHELDYAFHETLCTIADVDFAFEEISVNKAKVDRLCVLGLTSKERLQRLLDDHLLIAKRIENHDEQAAVEAGMLHLTRLDVIIEGIKQEHTDYFDD